MLLPIFRRVGTHQEARSVRDDVSSRSNEDGREFPDSRVDTYNSISAIYAENRPSYPEELFVHLSKLTSKRQRALDTATGNGQAAVPLARHFDEVIATDQCAGQINEAMRRPHPKNVEFRVARAGASGLEEGSVDLMTAAQAIHWLVSLDEYYQEVERVLRPGGVFAVWCYTKPRVSVLIDPIVDDLYNSRELWPYWADWRPLLDDAYRGLRLPFGANRCEFEYKMRETWTLTRFQDYLRTWPAIAQSRQNNDDQCLSYVQDVFQEIERAWGAVSLARTIEWNLNGRVDVRPITRVSPPYLSPLSTVV
jgi:ubiquinone/menaquinone biosynthesis C-methylase UbiE